MTGFLLQTAASISTIASVWAYGSKKLYGPLIGLVSQVPWWALLAHEGLWGLLPVNIAMVLLHARNTYNWSKA